jgi:methionine aminopeptidase
MGVSESMKHDLLEGYPVLTENKGDIVAQFKYTVMVLKNRTCIIAGLDVDASEFESENKVSS